MRRSVGTLILTLGLVWSSAMPAAAHGGGGTDATNFLSSIQGVAKPGPDGQPAGEAQVAGVSWRVIAGDVMLEVTNRTSKELSIPGYEGEPYLRISSDGVYRNRNSPATYLNEGRYGGEVPAEASKDSKPRWEKVSDKPTYYWHEHRIHWMSLNLPPQVQNDQTSERVVFDWLVPFSMADEAFVLTGQLKWVPPLQIWPWLLGALLLISLPFLGAMALRGERRTAYLLKTGSAAVILFSILSAIHSIDDLIAVPADPLANVFAAFKVFPFVISGVIAGLWAWRGRARPALALAIGAASISLGVGIAHVFALSNSQLATTLPELFSRIVFAGTMVLVLPAGVAAWLARPRLGAGQPVAAV